MHNAVIKRIEINCLIELFSFIASSNKKAIFSDDSCLREYTVRWPFVLE